MCNNELIWYARKYFAQIRETERRIQQLKYIAAVMRSDLLSQNYELKSVQVKSSLNPHRFEDKIIYVIDLEREIATKNKELSALKKEAHDRIRRIPDPDQQKVLIGLHLKNKQPEEIEAELNLSGWQGYGRVDRLHKRGLLAFAESNRDILEDDSQ